MRTFACCSLEEKRAAAPIIFFRPRGHISIHVVTSTMQVEKLHFTEVQQ